MARLKFFTDEDVYGAVAIGLRRLGWDAVSTPETGRMGQSDTAQLEWAAANNRAIITFNVADFAKLHEDFVTAGNHHVGIIVSSQRSIGDMLRRIDSLATALTAEAMADRLEFLGDW